MLNYSLQENLLTGRKNDFKAQPHIRRSFNKEELIDLMLQRGTLMTKTDALAVFNNIEETIVDIVSDGDTVHLPLFNIGFSISGAFDGAFDSFDPARHKLNVKINKGTLLRSVERKVKLTKVNAHSPQPRIYTVKDITTGTVDKILSSGGVVEINGKNIKITGNNPECGLYFVDDNGAQTKANIFALNKPSILIAHIPILAAGNYKLKIVTQYSKNKDLADTKTTVYGKTLQVQ
jgi:hypothetical protein